MDSIQRRLICHPDTAAGAVEFVDVELELSSERLDLWYTVRGDMGRIAIPPLAPERRVDGLWQTTCFEAFVRKADATGYREFNFSPSSEWAAYAFERYRQGMRPAPLIHPPIFSRLDQELMIEVHVTLPFASDRGMHSFALSAVIEETGGASSYWALAHPPGKPDFHHPDCFALELPAPDAP